MANQAIALQARVPQGNFLAPALQQGAQFINMMSQQRAAERQAAVQQQQLNIARTQESRAAAKAPFELAEAEEKALTAQQKNTLGFYDLVAAGVKNSSTPDQVMIVADFLKKTYPGATQQIDQKLSDMPADPAGFNAWREKTMLQSLDAKDQLTKEFTTQNLGTSTRVLRTPKFGGGAGEVVPGSEAAVNLKPTVINVEGIGGVIVDPNTGRGYPVAAGQTGGYTPPGLVGGDRGGGVATTPVATARGPQIEQLVGQLNPGVVVTGRARTPERNAEVGGVPNSLHMSDNARDFRPAAGQSVDDLFKNLSPLKAQGYDVVLEKNKNIVHVETGPGMGRAAPVARTPVAAPAPAAPSKTIEEASTQKALRKVLPIIGYNAETGASRVEDLIKASTSGAVEMIGSEIMGAATGKGTPGRAALGELSAIADNMTFEKLRGKLGAQISDADVRLIARTMADIANGNTPANVREAAWKNVVLPGLLRGAGMEPKTPTASAGRQTPTASAAAPPTAAVQMLRKNPTPAERKLFDSVFGAGAAAKALGSR